MRHSDIMTEFTNGTCNNAYLFLGCHKHESKSGYVFRVWAPNAKSVSVVGDFNFWNTEDLPMQKGEGGIWEAYSEYAAQGQKYKYYIQRPNGSYVYKNDPYAFEFAPLPEKSGLIGEIPKYKWGDKEYINRHKNANCLKSPVNIYEVHLGSWKRNDDGNFLTYREIAPQLVSYVKNMGYTHIELLPLTEYPYEPSWGYQVTGYFAPTARYGEPDGLMFLVDLCHKNNIGVIMDWVPAHFPKDEEGLYEYDGTYCYEVSHPKMNEHPDWGTRIFDYGKPQVKSFLISSALFWLREYHMDGIRVDAVASMLYLDYGRQGDYVPNVYGGNYNLEAIEFLKQLNQAAFSYMPGVIMAAEESTAFPMVTKPPFDGGLGFNFKWNMGWMHDILGYMSADPLFRKGRHNDLTFSMTYAFSENFILPFSHDEVVHGKKSMIDKMAGNYEEKFDNLRLLEAYRYTHPGKKLTFMGNEIAQFIEWDFKKGLDWLLMDYDAHRKFSAYERDLNKLYLTTPALWENDSDWQGFRWVSADDNAQSVIAFIRYDSKGNAVLCIFNFCPVLRKGYRLGLPKGTTWQPIFCSDRKRYAGKGVGLKSVTAKGNGMHSFDSSGVFTIPGLSACLYKLQGNE